MTPCSLEEAISLLAEGGEGARPLAGGATLVAMMNAKLVEPTRLVSLARIEELQQTERLPDGHLKLGAMRCHRQNAFESGLRDGQRVVSAAAAQIANPPVRNMGTLGGSIAFADPAADYPPALVAADASIEVAGPEGRRILPAESFFHGWYETDLQPGEIVTAVILPPAPVGSLGHYEKLCRVTGDFALASVAVTLVRGGATGIAALRFAVGGCGGGPIRVPAAEELLIKEGRAALPEAGALLQEALDPVDDARASADYRRQVAPRLLAKALAAASGRRKGRRVTPSQEVKLQINGKERALRPGGEPNPAQRAPRRSRADRQQAGLQSGGLRRLYGSDRRPAAAGLSHPCGDLRWAQRHHHRRPQPGRDLGASAGSLPRWRRGAVRLLHPWDGGRCPGLASGQPNAGARSKFELDCPATFAAVPDTRRSSKRCHRPPWSSRPEAVPQLPEVLAATWGVWKAERR